MKHLPLIILLMLSSAVFAQDDNNSVQNNIGWGVELMGTTSINHQPGNAVTIPFFGLGFYPRYNLYAPFKYLSVSAGVPVNLGLEVTSSSFSNYWQYFVDSPLEFALNFWERANSASDYLFGGYIGAGFGYNYSVYKDTFFDRKYNSSAFGPVFSLGLRYDYLGSPVGVRVSYMPGLFNNFKEDPCNCIEYEGGTTPQILTLSVLYHVR